MMYYGGHGMKDISKIPSDATEVRVVEIETLQSLKGIDKAKKITKVRIYNC